MLKRLTIITFISFTLISCGGNYSPKPYGYFRVDMPAHKYRIADTLNLPYKFELSDYAEIVSREEPGENYWIDINYPGLNCSVYCSYKHVKGNLRELSEDAHRYVYKHAVKADAINEKLFENPKKKVYGILYDLKGNTASSLQFVLTDSTRHFFRGALYFNNVPNKDSIAPMANYIREDMIRLIESFEWKK
ncbi:MAG: gliding motility lipoprotein GldD [Paludibacter sp.]|nr:gliding motility lipoprotein GldD [Paludibacter sp.]